MLGRQQLRAGDPAGLVGVTQMVAGWRHTCAVGVSPWVTPTTPTTTTTTTTADAEAVCCSDNVCKAVDKCGNEDQSLDLSTIWIIAVASAVLVLLCCGVVAACCVRQFSDRHRNPARITPRAFRPPPLPQAAAQQP